MSLRTNLVVEHNLASLGVFYREHEQEDLRAIDVKLKFVDFLLGFTHDEILHGIGFLQRSYKEVYDVVYPLITEYLAYGIKPFLDECDAYLPPEQPQTFLDKLCAIFKKDKCVKGVDCD